MDWQRIPNYFFLILFSFLNKYYFLITEKGRTNWMHCYINAFINSNNCGSSSNNIIKFIVSHMSDTCQGNTHYSISATKNKGWVYCLPCKEELCKIVSMSKAESSSYWLWGTRGSEVGGFLEMCMCRDWWT